MLFTFTINKTNSGIFTCTCCSSASAGYSPFEVCYAFQALSPYELLTALPASSRAHKRKEDYDASSFVHLGQNFKETP